MHRGRQQPPASEADALASLRHEISDLRSRLAASRTSDGLSTPDSPLALSPFSEDAAVITEWRSKYDRLYECYRRLQKTNAGLEDKLLRIVDKFEGEKNQMTRDLASQTQKLVDAKLTIQRLSDGNRELQSDLNLSINLLQNKPNSFVSPKVDSLPPEVRSRVKNYVEGRGTDSRPKREKEGKKIRVAIPDDLPLLGGAGGGPDDGTGGPDDCGAGGDRVSAAILAKVLEERDKERRAEAKFCIDVGTQTHGWQILNKSPSNNNSSSCSNSPQGTSSMSSSASASPPTSNETPRRAVILDESRFRMPVASNILLASVIHPAASTRGQGHESEVMKPSPSLTSHMLSIPQPHMNANGSGGNGHITKTTLIQRSATFSSLQTDI
jgi:hypothetical protein